MSQEQMVTIMPGKAILKFNYTKNIFKNTFTYNKYSIKEEKLLILKTKISYPMLR